MVDHDLDDIDAAFERLFEERGWRLAHRETIFGEFHYHSTAHEVIGIASGSAILGIGGPHSIRVTVDASDVIVLPASIGHARLADSSHVSVVSAYPTGQQPDMHRAMPALDDERAIAALPFPAMDPVLGVRSC